MRNGTRIPLLIVACLVAACLLFLGGFLLGLSPGARDVFRDVLPIGTVGGAEGEDAALQEEILDRLESTYYKEVDPDRLRADAINGMIAGLGDPYTVYMDPEEYASFQERTTGAYSGVGMTVELKDRLVTIVDTFEGSPAQQAGIRPGDIILAVDDVSTAGQNLDEVVGRIKGLEGTDVTLTIYRSPVTTTTSVARGEDDPDSGGEGIGRATADLSHLPPGGQTRDYTLRRKTIEVPVLESEVLTAGAKKVGLISFFTFSEGSADDLRAAVRKAVETDKVDAIILDLRSNGGGLLDEAVEVASIFIPDGVIVTTEGLHSPKEVYDATGGAYARVPLYVLTDAYTASASEIVSGALQDEGRATLVGETTFGKGLVQSIEPLSNGGAIKVTTAVYVTPNGRNINETGISPDVVAPDDPVTEGIDETVEAALKLVGGATSAL